ncbi:GNAT family N-acetyltransferase [Martelella endophytica]
MLRIRSRAFLQPWEPLWSVDDMTERAFRRRVRRVNLDYDAGTSIQLFIFLRQSDTLVGGITIGLIRRGVAQMCMLGYWMGEEYAGKGHMFAALQLVIPFIFDELRLHRIEAACIPTNERSASLLQKAGFSREGLLRRYLRINGVWQDHHLYALLNDENDAKRT